MSFLAHTQEELKQLNIKEDQTYKIQYLNRDYFNGDESLEITNAKALIDQNGNISFIVSDDYGMDKFIKDVRVIN